MKTALFGERGSSRDALRCAVSLSVFSALSYVVMLFVKFPVPPVTLDLKDAVITLAAILYGAYAGPLISLLVALLEMVTVSTTGLYGFVMNFCGSALFSFTASLCVRRSGGRRGFFVGLPTAVLAMTAGMLLMNYLVTPIYYGMERRAVLPMLSTFFLPFNLAKGTLNAVVLLLLYPPVSGALVKARLRKEKDAPTLVEFTKKNAVLFGVALLAASLVAVGLLLLLLL